MENEIWKPVVGFEGLYEASSLGRIKSLPNYVRNSEKILRAHPTKCGYPSITLVKDKVKYTRTVHRLVATAFLGESDLPVNHKDGSKLNNHIDNLEFVTASENMQHAIRNGLLKCNTYNIAESKRKRVVQIDKVTLEVIKVHASAHHAARDTKQNRGNISSCCRGLTTHAGGFICKFETV